MRVTRMSTLREGRGAAACLLAALGLSCAPAVRAAGTSSITLEWTAPGDDRAIGIASRYDLRYSQAPISAGNFLSAAPATQVPHPSKPGQRERVKIHGLQPDTRYYFALKTVDDNGNWSGMSNVVVQTAPDPETAPSLFPLSLSPPAPNPARGSVQLVLSLPREASVRLIVVDAGGRIARQLLDSVQPAGETPIQWNLTDRFGRTLPAGNYWITGQVGSQQLVQRLTVIP